MQKIHPTFSTAPEAAAPSATLGSQRGTRGPSHGKEEALPRVESSPRSPPSGAGHQGGLYREPQTPAALESRACHSQAAWWMICLASQSPPPQHRLHAAAAAKAAEKP